ncbi:MAG: lysophospholipid acyltransferase family protein, partial [Reichenbachiella sp.]
LSFHYSNHELLAQKISEYTGNMYGAYEPLKNPFADNLLSKIRNRKNQYVKKFYGRPWDVFDLVNRRGVFGFMVDQSFNKHNTKELFFGKECSYLNLPNLVQKKCRAMGYVCSIKRVGLKQYEIYCLEGDSKDGVISFANDVLELLVRDRPELWYGWFHRRFKSID